VSLDRIIMKTRSTTPVAANTKPATTIQSALEPMAVLLPEVSRQQFTFKSTPR
jgi:hypothetical protein